MQASRRAKRPIIFLCDDGAKWGGASGCAWSNMALSIIIGKLHFTVLFQFAPLFYFAPLSPLQYALLGYKGFGFIDRL